MSKPKLFMLSLRIVIRNRRQISVNIQMEGIQICGFLVKTMDKTYHKWRKKQDYYKKFTSAVKYKVRYMRKSVFWEFCHSGKCSVMHAFSVFTLLGTLWGLHSGIISTSLLRLTFSSPQITKSDIWGVTDRKN